MQRRYNLKGYAEERRKTIQFPYLVDAMFAQEIWKNCKYTSKCFHTKVSFDTQEYSLTGSMQSILFFIYT